jgi:pimeloyl-ACP methyl ester carboxylesterase
MRTTAYLVPLVAGVLLAGVGGCGGTAASSSTLSWNSCDGSFKCAKLSVPVSYSDPHGTQIPISVIELPASRPHPTGDIVFNPGGPGGSGVQFLEQAGRMFPASLRARFNLVSFDPRGVGSSHPLQCLTPAGIEGYAAVNPAPRTPKQIAAVVSATKDFVRGCEKNASTDFITSMSTANNARDMDRLRAALGQKRLTYFGFSYGTYLGTVYAELFPKRIRGMVLDGAVDPSIDGETALADQAAGFEKDLNDFFAWCAKNSSCSSGFSDSPAKAYAALFARLEKGHTLSAVVQGRTRDGLVDYGIALGGVLAALYSPEAWPVLGQALSSAESGDGSYLAAFAYALAGLNPDGSFSNIVSANTATTCLDFSAPQTLREREELARRLSQSAPHFGAAEAWTGLACPYLPAHKREHLSVAHAADAPPILVVGSTDDPATPYVWAKALAKQLPRATLLTRSGAGHTAYRSSSCIRNWADRYLETLKMPPAGTVCPSD